MRWGLCKYEGFGMIWLVPRKWRKTLFRRLLSECATVFACLLAF